MKRKLFLGTLIVCVCVFFFGCQSNTAKLVEDNMSEITKVYYFASAENFSVSISCGQRENNYITDGVSGDLVDFCLLRVDLKESCEEELKKAKLIVNGEQEDVELLLNVKNGAYMVDLERKLDGTEKIEIVFMDTMKELLPISNNFSIDHKKAIQIATEQLEEKIEKAKSFNNLNAECYLRVLNKDINNLDEVYWCFTIFNTKGEDFSVVISTQDGSILAKSE